MLGLPHPPTFDARTRVERVNDAPSEDLLRDRRRRNEEVPGCSGGSLGLARRCFAEQQPETWPGWTKLCHRSHRYVALKPGGKQEHAINGRTALEIRKVHGAELVDQRALPVIEHIGDWHAVGDGEGQVQVGEAVALVQGERAHGGSGKYALVLLREPYQAITDSVPLLNGEHEPRLPLSGNGFK